MNREKAINIIENLRDYAYENWDDLEYEKQLDEIGEAVNFIKSQLQECKNVGTIEIGRKKYFILEKGTEQKCMSS